LQKALAEQWELQRELCDAKALHIQTEKETMDKELFELEEEYAKKFGKEDVSRQGSQQDGQERQGSAVSQLSKEGVRRQAVER
jgi:hypothetical protein